MRAFVAAALGAAVLLSVANGFMSPAVLATPRRARQHTATATGRATTMSYADKLRAAREAKAAASRGKGSPAPGIRAEASTPSPAPTPAAPAAGRGGGAAPLPADSEPPFDPHVLDAIRSAITILAGRLQREKPMSRSEFEAFESAVSIIVEDALPMQELPVQAATPAAPAASAVAVPPPPAEAAATSIDLMESEGPEWDPEGGYGVATGTRNTYVIEGMGAMNPEEYQEAVREKVIARAQSARKSGSYGNIVAKEYLSFLGKNEKSGTRPMKKKYTKPSKADRPEDYEQ